jgi:hypothetical protein
MKTFGIKKDEPILMVDEDRLTIKIIQQIRNYLDCKEKELNTKTHHERKAN